MFLHPFAKNILDKFKDRFDFGLSLIDENGITVASSDPACLNTFHELAYMLILSKRQSPMKITQAADYLGARTGVCSILDVGGETVGSFALHGDPDRLLPLTDLMRCSLENALEYEQRMLRREKSHQETRSSFARTLIYPETGQKTDVTAQATSYGYNPDLIRLPILIQLHGPDSERPEFIRLMRAQLSDQDILTETHDQNLFLFKLLPSEGINLLQHYKAFVSEQMINWQTSAVSCNCTITAYCGSLLADMSQYHLGSQHSFWLLRHVTQPSIVNFFYDHLEMYLQEQIPAGEYHRLFRVIAQSIDKKTADQLVRIITTLDQHNYNLVASSQPLFMHRNTLAQTLDRIKELTDTDPVKKASDRKFLKLLAYYLTIIGENSR